MSEFSAAVNVLLRAEGARGDEVDFRIIIHLRILSGSAPAGACGRNAMTAKYRFSQVASVSNRLHTGCRHRHTSANDATSPHRTALLAGRIRCVSEVEVNFRSSGSPFSQSIEWRTSVCLRASTLAVDPLL